MDDERLGVADIGQMAGQLDVVDEPYAGLPAALDAEADDGAGPLGQIALGQGMPAPPPALRLCKG